MKYLMSAVVAALTVRAFGNGPSAIGMAIDTNESAETVTIKTANGPVRINKSDYNEDEHTLFEKETKTHNEDGTAKNPEPGPSGVTALSAEETELRNAIAELHLGVVQEGVKFFVVNQEADGSVVGKLNVNSKGKPNPENKWEFPGIDPKGYETNKEAWEATFKLKGLVTPPAIPTTAIPVAGQQ